MKLRCPECGQAIDCKGTNQVVCPNCQAEYEVDAEVRKQYLSETETAEEQETVRRIGIEALASVRKTALSKVDRSDGNLHKWADIVRRVTFVVGITCGIILIILQFTKLFLPCRAQPIL